jgi:hypothetical protein
LLFALPRNHMVHASYVVAQIWKKHYGDIPEDKPCNETPTMGSPALKEDWTLRSNPLAFCKVVFPQVPSQLIQLPAGAVPGKPRITKPRIESKVAYFGYTHHTQTPAQTLDWTDPQLDLPWIDMDDLLQNHTVLESGLHFLE